MTGPAQVEVTNPLAAIDALFQQRVATQAASTADGGSLAARAEFGVQEHFVSALGLEDEENFAKIPCLNDTDIAEAVPPFSLVRFRGLVQDVFEQEIYTAAFLEEDAGVAEQQPGQTPQPPRLVTTKYREWVDPAPGRQFTDLGREGYSQRGVFYCVPLPGETAWARAATATGTPRAAKPAVGLGVPPPPTPPPAALKRARQDEDTEMTPEAAEPQRPRVGAAAKPTKSKFCGGFSTGGDVGNGVYQTAEEFGLNFPLPEEEQRGKGSSTACLVKTYGRQVEEDIKVLEVVEVVGVLCVHPEMAYFAPDAPEPGCITGFLGDDARHPSTALVPRLHTILVRRLPFYHPLLPFAPAWLTEARLAAAYERRFPGGAAALEAARAAALGLLARHLGGDALAAEYVLMLLVSRAFGKHDDRLLGGWSMNILNWPEAASSRTFLESALAELVPRAVYQEISNETLHSQRWRPRKDFVANRLVAARLQLASGTLLLLDETGMKEGKLEAEAVRNLRAVNDLVSENSLTCDFSYDVKLGLELFCILVSRGASMIQAVDVAVPLRPESSGATVAPPVDTEALAAARFLIGLLTRNPRPVQIPDAMASDFSDNFAAVRQEFKVQPQLCHTWLCLARARCLLYGEDTLTPARWQQVLELERQRLQRLHSR